MTKIILSGYNGAMGKVVRETVKKQEDFSIVAGIDIACTEADFKVFSSPQQCNVKGDVIIDFSHAALIQNLLLLAIDTHTPIVICTTGFDEASKLAIKNASSKIPVFTSANMSLGVFAIKNMVKNLTAILGKDFDVEIVEKHHNQKVDAPSGTAIMLFEAVKSSRPSSTAVYDRHLLKNKRSADEVGIHSLRCGAIVGEHEVVFASDSEIIEIKHTALNKSVFADGALRAAKFVVGKKNGLYCMDDLIRGQND